jgi:hypothetical protein
MPGTFVYALLGSGVGSVLERGTTPNLNIIFDSEIFLPLLGLATLSLLPILYKKLKKRRKH